MADGRSEGRADGSAWPPLPYEAWKGTCATLHRWLQIVGKVRLVRTPWVNHQWHVALQVTARGLTTGPMPAGGDSFQMDVDFIDHLVRILRSDGRQATVELRPRTVADFYRALMDELRRLDLEVRIHGAPNEVPDAIPFAEDEWHRSYDPDAAHRFWRILSSAERVFSDFRGRFIGKASPVQFYWGAMDLAVTRFSGRRAPEHPGGAVNFPNWLVREAASHEVISAGFWPGGDSYPHPVFYAYAYPEPPGLPDAEVAPEAAGWSTELSEFVLPYEAVRTSDAPEADLMAFLESTYEAGADLGGWDRGTLEWGPEGRPRLP